MATPKNGYWLNGKRLPSVTTILGRFKDSGALIKWAYGVGREHGGMQAQNEIIEKGRMLDAAGAYDDGAAYHALSDVLGEDWLTRPLPDVPADQYAVTKKAADAGTIAHDAIEQHVLSKGSVKHVELVFEGAKVNGATQDVLDRARNAYEQFKVWLANTGIEITHTELSLVSEKHRFGGTLDGVGKDNSGNVVLIDWKTSNAVYADYLVQLAAYALLLEEKRPELTPQDFHLLRVAKESADFAHYRWGELDVQKKQFLLMRELYELDGITKKRVG